MSSFSEVVKPASGARRPPRVVVLPPSAFADDWGGKPAADVAIGLRLPSENHLQMARSQAAQAALELHDRPGEEDDAIAAYNDALVRYAVSGAACDPNDVSKPYFDFAEETIKHAMTSEGVRRLWDELEKLQIEKSPVHSECTDEELAELAELLQTGDALERLATPSARRVRRFLRFCLDDLRLAADLD